MNRRTWVLKAFLSQCPPQTSDSLERFLPDQERRDLSSLPFFEPPRSLRETPLLDQVHWSWFLPTLKSHEKKDQTYFFAALEKSASEGLAHELKTPLSLRKISKMGRAYLQTLLLHSLVGPDAELLPSEFLPPSPLNQLLDLSKKGLTHLIDGLSLYDLACELRQILETKILKKIYSFLKEEEKALLKTAMVQKEPYSWPKMGLDRWEGGEESFRHSLHKRGLARFAVALSGQDPDLVWYICHQLDIGRGTALFKLCAAEPIPSVSDWVIRQIQELLSNRELAK